MPGNQEFMQHRPQRRLSLGITASVAAHIVMILAFRAETARELLPVVPEAAQSLLVWVKPRRAPEPERIVQQDKPVAKPLRRPQRALQQAQEKAFEPQPVIALEPRPQDDPFHVQPAPPDKPFDIDAARVAARNLATSPDPARAGLPVGQFDKERNRVKPDDPVARKIAQAKRRNCKDGIPGELLAPLLLLMDKKDHGCKW